MAALNAQFLAHQGATDVITFSYLAEPADPADERRLAGEIYVCPALAVARAARYHVAPGTELLRYIVHGLLHLAGWDDATPVQRARMRAAESRLLARLGSPRAGAGLLTRC